MRKMLVVPALVLALVAAAPRSGHAGLTLPKCAAGKRKAAGKKALAKAKCYATAIKTNTAVSPTCLSAAETAFDTAFNAADLVSPPAGCVGIPATTEEGVDSCVQHLLDAIPVTPGLEKCASGKVLAAGTDALKKLICYATAAKKGGHCSTTTKNLCVIDSDCAAASPTCPKCVAGETCNLTPVDPLCLSKFSTLIGVKFAAAESKGACPGTASALDATVDAACVNSIYPSLPARLPGCGNNVVEQNLGETCDDGNTQDGDGCPASCHVDACAQPISGSFLASVTYTGPVGTTISGLGVFVDYPEAKVSQPAVTPAFGVSSSPTDQGYGFTDEALKLGGLPTTFLHMNFKNCNGATAPVASDFHCTVNDASDDLGNPVDPATVTCTVTVP